MCASWAIKPIEIASPSQALLFLKGNAPPDVAIVDFAMPEMTGVRLAEKIRELCPDLPLLLATGYADEAGVTQLPRLDKPFSLDDLARQIDRALASH